MNIKLITKAMHALSLLSDEDVAMVMKLRGLSEDERQMLMLVLEPQKPATKSTERTIEHCAACDYTRRAKVHKDATADGYHEFQPSSRKSAGKGGGGKSARGESLASAIKDRRDGRCVAELLDGETCKMMPSHTIHDKRSQDVNAHEYLSAAQLDKSLQGQRRTATDKDDEFPDLLGDHEACAFNLRGQQCGAAADANVHHLNTSVDYHEFVAPPATHAASGGD